MALKIGSVNQKGGVGKTTTAICLCDALTQIGYKVLLIDFDPQGNASSVYEASDREKTVYDALLKNLDPKEAIVQGSPMGDILPASTELKKATYELVSLTARETKLRKLMKKLDNDYDIIVVDSGPSAGIMMQNVLSAVDGIVIPMQAETFSISGLGSLLADVEEIKESYNEDLTIYGVLITDYDKKKSIQVDIAEQTKSLENIGLHVFNTVIRDSAAIPKTQGHTSIEEPKNLAEVKTKESKGSIFKYGNNNGAVDYSNFAKELLEVINNG